MKKHELIAALEKLDDDIEIWMECDAGFAPVGSADYQTYHPDNKDEMIVVLVPLT